MREAGNLPIAQCSHAKVDSTASPLHYDAHYFHQVIAPNLRFHPNNVQCTSLGEEYFIALNPAFRLSGHGQTSPVCPSCWMTLTLHPSIFFLDNGRWRFPSSGCRVCFTHAHIIQIQYPISIVVWKHQTALHYFCL